MSSEFYRAFEDRYRGSRELIKSRLRVYLPFIAPLKSLGHECIGVDLGCGRGEWLELLSEAGVTSHGVDLDAGMLAACRELDLSVEIADAIASLKVLPDESRDIVSGFHIAEHLPFSKLQALVQEALRVLKPAGLLILETPNPENIRVATSNFYLDPTHQRPIPPQLLAFLPEHYGFYRTKILRLQESQELAANMAPALMSILDGSSPDYAIVAQKEAAPEVLGNFDAAFAREYGLTVEELAMRYESNTKQNLSSAIQLANRVAEQAESIAQWSEVRAQQLHQELVARGGELAQTRQQLVARGGELAQTRQQLVAREGELAQTRQQLVVREGELAQTRQQLVVREGELAQTRRQLVAREGELSALIHSRSWRITRPVRECAHLLRRVRNKTRAIVKEMIKSLLARAISFAKVRPALKSRLVAWVSRYPALNARLRRFAAARGLVHTLIGSTPSVQPAPQEDDFPSEYQNLTPRARRIYHDLKTAIEANRNEGGL